MVWRDLWKRDLDTPGGVDKQKNLCITRTHTHAHKSGRSMRGKGGRSLRAPKFDVPFCYLIGREIYIPGGCVRERTHTSAQNTQRASEAQNLAERKIERKEFHSSRKSHARFLFQLGLVGRGEGIGITINVFETKKIKRKKQMERVEEIKINGEIIGKSEICR